MLSGGLPAFVAPAYDGELGMANGVEPAELARVLDAEAGGGAPFRAVFVVSPTYYGMVADVPALAQVAHDRGVPLVVDQSWGPHFGFHPELPQSALRQGADAVLTSTHKIVGSLTQSAMLHVAATGRIDPSAVSRAVRLVRSTSPSSLLLASLDGARRQLAVHGEALLHETLRAGRVTREKLGTTPGIAVVGPELVGRPGIADWDPLRLVLDVRDTGCSGYEVAEALRHDYDVQVELATHSTIVSVLGVAERPEALERFAGDVDEIVKRIRRAGSRDALVRPSGFLRNEMAVAPREAFLGEGEVVPVGRGGRPGLLRVDRRLPAGHPGAAAGRADHRGGRGATSSELVGAGARLHGAGDPSFATVRVLRVPRS